MVSCTCLVRRGLRKSNFTGSPAPSLLCQSVASAASVVLPNSGSGILTGLILVVCRAVGETAPIMFTGAVFLRSTAPHSVFDKTMALSLHLFSINTQLTDVPDASVGLSLERLRDQLEAQDVQLWSLGGQLIASAGQSRMQLSPERPSAGQLRLVRAQRIWTAIEGFDDTDGCGKRADISQIQ